jgi:ornithine carbamoyltransferase
VICSKLGVHFTVITPARLNPGRDLIETCSSLSAASGASIRITGDTTAVEGADALYTDVWTSMGEEDKKTERRVLLEPYRVNSDLMARTGKKDTVFLHCLPAVRGEEVSPEVIDGPASLVWDEAENRKHTIKAIMLATLGCILYT